MNVKYIKIMCINIKKKSWKVAYDVYFRSKNLRSSYFYMMGLKTFFDSNYDDSK